MMPAYLLVMSDSRECERATDVWRKACAQTGWELKVYNIATPPGEQLVKRLRITTLPALIIDDEIAAVGVPDLADASNLLAAR